MTENTYTLEEYLLWDRAVEYPNEYLDGRIYAMSGGSREHSLIAGNMHRDISLQLMGKPCTVHGSDMRVKVSAANAVFHPDVSAVCGRPQLEGGRRDLLLNPTVIIEVLSPSTERYDRGRKFARYRHLESLAEYILVAQDEMRVEQYVREGGKWTLTEITDLDGSLDLASIGVSLRLRRIYDKIEFPPLAPADGMDAD